MDTKNVIITVILCAITGLLQAAPSCPRTLANLNADSKAAGWRSEGDLYARCNPYCDAGSKALPFFNKDEAAQCACYCSLKGPEFKKAGAYQDAKKAERYAKAADVLADYAAKKNIAVGTVPAAKK